MDAGVDAIRLNPGNIGSIDRIKEVVDRAKALGIPIRIGVNSGSIDRSIYNYDQELTAQHLVNSAMKHVKILEDLGFLILLFP